MITAPDNLDADHVARVRALLDAFIALGRGSLMLHESTIEHLPWIVWSWAHERNLRISTHQMVRKDGDAYESWDVYSAGATMHVFPKEMGLLDGNSEQLKKQIAAIQEEAAARIKAACEQARKAAQL